MNKKTDTIDLEIACNTEEIDEALDKIKELVELTEDLNEAQSRIIIRNNKDCEINIFASSNRLEGLEGIEECRQIKD